VHILAFSFKLFPGMKQSVLIIDDDLDVLNALAVLLEDEFDSILTESNSIRIPALVAGYYDIILLDMNFSAGVNSGNEGLFWLSKILEARPAASVIMMTAYGNIAIAVEAIKRGAKDFVLKPWDNEKLITTLRATIAMGKTSGKKQPALEEKERVHLIGKSKPMMVLQEQIAKVAGTDASVLILGENGTGKEIVARELHRLSKRGNEVFISVDLSTITPNLFESELFGHKKGSFTDAHTDRQGRFEMAHGGTLFLDEIGNLPVEQQAKLLTALQNMEVTPVGSNIPVPVNVRLLSATNAPLPQWAMQGRFRQDLLFRINTISLTLPALRDRGDDILLLATYFLEIYKTKYTRDELALTDDAKEALLRYSWPGNVRELQHTMEKAVILGEGAIITNKELNLLYDVKSSYKNMPETSEADLWVGSFLNKYNVVKTLDDLEKDALLRALNSYNGNVVQAAKALGITRQTLYNKMKKYGI
jgi:two-component system response regulator HydG